MDGGAYGDGAYGLFFAILVEAMGGGNFGVGAHGGGAYEGGTEWSLIGELLLMFVIVGSVGDASLHPPPDPYPHPPPPPDPAPLHPPPPLPHPDKLSGPSEALWGLFSCGSFGALLEPSCGLLGALLMEPSWVSLVASEGPLGSLRFGFYGIGGYEEGCGGVGGAKTPDLPHKGAAAKRPTAPEARGAGETNTNWDHLMALGPAGPSPS